MSSPYDEAIEATARARWDRNPIRCDFADLTEEQQAIWLVDAKVLVSAFLEHWPREWVCRDRFFDSECDNGYVPTRGDHSSCGWRRVVPDE